MHHCKIDITAKSPIEIIKHMFSIQKLILDDIPSQETKQYKYELTDRK